MNNFIISMNTEIALTQINAVIDKIRQQKLNDFKASMSVFSYPLT